MNEETVDWENGQPKCTWHKQQHGEIVTSVRYLMPDKL